MNRVALSASVGAGDESVEVTDLKMKKTCILENICKLNLCVKRKWINFATQIQQDLLIKDAYKQQHNQ